MSGGKLKKLPWYLRYRVAGGIASAGRKWMIQATHLHARVEFNGPVRIGPGFHLDMPNGGEFIVGYGVDFRRGFVCEIGPQGRVSIGDLTVFTNTALIQCSTSIDIGARCGFGQATFIVDGNHRFRDGTKHWLDQGDEYRPISIGEGVAVNTKCTVINSIGDHAVIGANSVVTRPIPPYCLAVGAPARVVEYFGPPDMRPAELPADA